jgi:hypothetical protein
MKRLRRIIRDEIKNMPVYYPMAVWILRLALLFYVILEFGPRLSSPDIHSEYFHLALIFIIFTSLLFLGGFMRKSYLTRISAFILVLTTLVYLIAAFLIYQNAEVLASRFLFLAILIFFSTFSKKYNFYP